MKKIIVSIIIVHYKASDILLSCLNSLYLIKNRTPYEVIVVDNDIENPIEDILHKKYPSVRYIKAPWNVGFGRGNNIGAKVAKGKYLFFLNSDTIINDSIVDNLCSFLDVHQNTAVVAPLLLDRNEKIFPLQGTMKLTPFVALFSLSIVNKIFPKNPVTKKYWLSKWDKSKDKEVDVVPGTAIMIRKNIFEKLNGFDEHIFLYFEEFDLCLRSKELGYSIFITPKSKLIHLWGESTKHRNDLQKIFNHSRFYYFRKHFGIIQALIIEMFLRFDKNIMLLFIILLTATFLRFYDIQTLIPFISDQGWFYLSAKDMLQNGQIPLVGITASHVWLHQGAYWTYLLAICLFFFHFNPISGAYLTASIDVLTVYFVYLTGKMLFSKLVGFISACLYATSPLIIVYSRTAYHTSLIPFFTILFILAMTYWIRGNTRIIPFIISLLCILYNFEIATISLSFVFGAVLIYGFWQKRSWVHIFTKRNIIFSIVAYFVTMFPMILYDTSHQFPQTIKILFWIPYKLLSSSGIYRIHAQSYVDWIGLFNFLSLENQRLIFMQNSLLAVMIFLCSFIFLISLLYTQWVKGN